MPRPRAPTRELFEFTNRRRDGGKCDLYRCKRCGREMLENTHRFAIHICICKKATDQDREVAKGQLRKTKKYSMRANNSSVLATPEHDCRSETDGQSSISPMLYDDSQELLMPLQPTMSRRLSQHQQSSQQNKFDMFDCQLLEPSATIFETVPQVGGGMALSNLEDHYRMAASSMFDSHCPTAASAHQYQMMAADGGTIFGNNHHQQSSTDPVMMFDQRPHRTLVSRQRSQMPPSYHHQWGSVYSSSLAFESRPAASTSSMGGKQPYTF